LPPIQQAFDNAYRLLKPNGIFIFTVPFSLDENTVEHFPEIHNFQIIKNVDQYVLENKTSQGELQIFKDLIFHGGPGSTLEMRIFSKKSLLEHLHQAGFKDVRFQQESCLEFGINWSHNWSIPITARA
jgi:ubiquinone/menaquinone biosynthesis C-methylase UbiE